MQGPVIMANPRGPRVWSYTHTHFTYIPPATCVCSMVHLVKVTAVPMQHPSFGSFGSFANRWPLYKSRWGQVESVWSTQGTPQRWKDPTDLKGCTWIGFIVVHSNPECFIVQQIDRYTQRSQSFKNKTFIPLGSNFTYGCFLKWWYPKYPQIIHVNRIFHNNPFLGYPHDFGSLLIFGCCKLCKIRVKSPVIMQSRKTMAFPHLCSLNYRLVHL